MAAGFLLLIVCCIKWVDRPAALWAHEHVHNRAVFAAMTYLIYPIMAFVCLRMAGYAVEAIF
ncbi:MAG TPA: hypothetical protein VN516_06370, partial [Candidatus Baltobacteraceae bacterium]|nr:hypothetical protein [Candidatus Baltobacteraceae bacterium]